MNLGFYDGPIICLIRVNSSRTAYLGAAFGMTLKPRDLQIGRFSNFLFINRWIKTKVK